MWIKKIITLADNTELQVGDPDVIHHRTPLWDIDDNLPFVMISAMQKNDTDEWVRCEWPGPIAGQPALETWERQMADELGNIWKLTLTIENEAHTIHSRHVHEADWSDADCEIIEANADYVGHNVPGGHDIINAVFDVGSRDDSRHVIELTVDDYIVAQNKDMASWWNMDLQHALEASNNPIKTLGNHMRAILINSYDSADYDDDDPAKQLIADNAGWWHIRVDNRKIRL